MFQSKTADEQDGNIIEDCNDNANNGNDNDNNSNPIDSHEDYPGLVGSPSQEEVSHSTRAPGTV